MDAGKTSTVFEHNLDLIGVDSVDKVVLSHGHDDHTGGLPVLLNTETKFLMHSDALIPKYAVIDGKSRYIGFPKSINPELDMDMDFINKTTKIGSNLWIFNHVESYCDFETIPAYLSIKKDGKFLKDKFSDELNMVIKTENGLMVLSGCAHLGIVNIISSVREYFQDEIYAVIGGSHLINSTSQRIEKTMAEFQKIGPEIIALGHCTGFEALCRFSKEFKNNFIPLESGAEITVK